MTENFLTKCKEKNGILYRVCHDFPEEGVKFIDLTPSIINTECRMNLLSNLVNHIKNEVGEIDGIISPDARGFIWGMGVATLMNTSFIPVRKAGKLPANCISSGLTYNTEYSTTSVDLPLADFHHKRYVFVDDIYATGGTYNACKTLVEMFGGEIVKALVIYDVGINDNSDVYSIEKGSL